MVRAVLLLGVSVSGLLIAVGLVFATVVGWDGALAGTAPGGKPPTDFGAAVDNLRALRPIGFAQLGLIVLIFTPVARVAVSVVGFGLEGDRLYVAVTTVVLIILMTSLLLIR
jgi:uncharacterized membrane protein